MNKLEKNDVHVSDTGGILFMIDDILLTSHTLGI